MEKKRVAYFDVAKGILILLLVFAHFRSAVARVPFESEYFSWVYVWNRIFTCFYMPAFFFISGYCSNFKKSPRDFFVSLAKNLLLPLVTLNVIDVMLSSAVNQQNILSNLYTSFTHSGGLWFLNALLIGKVINYLIEKVPKYIGGGVLLLLITGIALNQYGIGHNVFYYQHGLVASFWVGIGKIFRERSDWYELCMKWSLYLYPIVVVATFIRPVAFVGTERIFGFSSLPFHIFYSLVGTFFLLNICRRIGESKAFEYWGKHSIVVYALHFTPLLFLTKTLWTMIMPDNGFMFLLFFILLYVLEYSICWLFMKLFEYNPFCYLIGKF